MEASIREQKGQNVKLQDALTHNERIHKEQVANDQVTIEGLRKELEEARKTTDQKIEEIARQRCKSHAHEEFFEAKRKVRKFQLIQL